MARVTMLSPLITADCPEVIAAVETPGAYPLAINPTDLISYIVAVKSWRVDYTINVTIVAGGILTTWIAAGSVVIASSLADETGLVCSPEFFEEIIDVAAGTWDNGTSSGSFDVTVGLQLFHYAGFEAFPRWKLLEDGTPVPYLIFYLDSEAGLLTTYIDAESTADCVSASFVGRPLPAYQLPDTLDRTSLFSATITPQDYWPYA